MTLPENRRALQGLVTFSTDRQQEGEPIQLLPYFYFTAFNDTDTFQFASIEQKKVGGIQVHLKKENVVKNWFISVIQFQK